MQGGELSQSVGGVVGPSADGEMVGMREQRLVTERVEGAAVVFEGGPCVRTVRQGEGGLLCIHGASVSVFDRAPRRCGEGGFRLIFDPGPASFDHRRSVFSRLVGASGRRS